MQMQKIIWNRAQLLDLLGQITTFSKKNNYTNNQGTIYQT